MGRQIEDDYRDKPLTIVAVLTGSLIALADLVRQIRIPLRIALLQASSYRGATTTATTLVINEAFAPDVVGRDVLLLDDILDTGQTLGALVEHLKDRGRQIRPNRCPPPQDRPPDRTTRARLLRVRDPRRLRRRLWPGLQRRVSPSCRTSACFANERSSDPLKTGPGDAAVSAADRRRRESPELSGGGTGAAGADVTVVTSRITGPGAGRARGSAGHLDRKMPGRRDMSLRAAEHRAAGDLTAAVLGNLALHAEPRAVVSGEPGRPGVCLDAQARCL